MHLKLKLHSCSNRLILECWDINEQQQKKSCLVSNYKSINRSRGTGQRFIKCKMAMFVCYCGCHGFKVPETKAAPNSFIQRSATHISSIADATAHMQKRTGKKKSGSCPKVKIKEMSNQISFNHLYLSKL